MRSCILPVAVRKIWIVMFILCAFCHELTKKRAHVIPQSILNLGEKHTGSRVQRGNYTHAVPYTTLSKESPHFGGQIKKLHFLSRLNLYGFGFNQHRCSPSPFYSSLHGIPAHLPECAYGIVPRPSMGNSSDTRSSADRNGEEILFR